MAGTSSFNDSGYPLLQSDYIDNIIGLLQISEDGTTLDVKDLISNKITKYRVSNSNNSTISSSDNYYVTTPALMGESITLNNSSNYSNSQPFHDVLPPTIKDLCILVSQGRGAEIKNS